jgi:hypothetical protein
MESAFYGRGPVGAAIHAGVEVSVTVGLDRTVKSAIAALAQDAWHRIVYTHAVIDDATGRCSSHAEVAA